MSWRRSIRCRCDLRRDSGIPYSDGRLNWARKCRTGRECHLCRVGEQFDGDERFDRILQIRQSSECDRLCLCRSKVTSPSRLSQGRPFPISASCLPGWSMAMPGVPLGRENPNTVQIKSHSQIIFVLASSIYCPLGARHFLDRFIHSRNTACRLVFSRPSRMTGSGPKARLGHQTRDLPKICSHSGNDEIRTVRVQRKTER
jgi:hypothetical protein